MKTPTPDRAQWIKAAKSAGDNACVEMRRPGGDVEVRDTKQSGRGLSLQVRRAAFAAWVAGAKSGELDDLI